ncbi:MAG: ABC transporter ATP-binding protein, partial [Candidatus Competibacteraceae bacterium]|nr:ABC transporter ATP-binding protein [Candidatus Competibacteraceae bacterium]
ITRTASRLLFFMPGRRVEYDLKNRLLAHLTTLQRDFFRTNTTGALISRLNNDINGVRMLMGFGLLQLCNSIAMLSLAPYRMYLLSPLLTALIAGPIVITFVILQLAISKLRLLQQQQMRALQTISDFTLESYNGLEVLRTYQALDWPERRFGTLSAHIRDLALNISRLRAYFLPLMLHVLNALKVLVVLAGGLMIVRAELTVGELTAYLLYLSMLLPPLTGMSFMLFVLQRGMTALESLETVLLTKPSLPPPDPAAQNALPATLQQGLEVRSLSYAYPEAPEQTVLKNISLAIKPGEIVGVFGPIGSGKSTLVNCLNGYLQPAAATIFLDGIDSTRISRDRLRQHIVTVSQTPFLFSATIRENLRLARPDLTQQQALEALHAAALQEDLQRFPAGLDTLAGEKGINLSGGQKQRLALARALLTPCDLLILDDVLSAVDHETERFLIDQIYRFQHARSLLIVSHRVSALERADRIIVLEQGQMIAQGTHNELIEQCELYQRAWQLQEQQAPAA